MALDKKLKKVEELRKELEEAPVIALIDMHKMPSKQLQEIRKKLRGKAKIKMTTKSVLKFALESAKKDGMKDLISYDPAQPAIALTDMGAFKFYNFTESLRFKTFAKGGDIAIEDMWVSAGPTQLMAGPVISELQQAGIPASIEGGRIKIRNDVCVVKKDEVITTAKANILRKLKVESMEVVLNVVAVYDGGVTYAKDTLELTRTFPRMIVRAFNNAMNLSVFISFPTKQNIRHLIGKASKAASAIKSIVDVRTSAASGGKKEPAGETVGVEKGDANGKDGNVESIKTEVETKEEHGGAS
jgi:large subunit ribosomal protein L10